MYIMIDPGHGGKDPGASGFGLSEKNVALKLAKKINDCLGQYDNAVVSLTRWDDRFLELSERADLANKQGCDIFLSIHNNAASESASGFESYIYTKAGSRTASYQNVIHRSIMNYLAQYNIRDRGQKRGNFAVLKGTRMPALLLENMFISNQRENKLLRDEEFLNGLAEAIASGVAAVFGLRKKNKQPKPMYKISINGKIICDTAYESKLLNTVLSGVRQKAQEIKLTRR